MRRARWQQGLRALLRFVMAIHRVMLSRCLGNAVPRLRLLQRHAPQKGFAQRFGLHGSDGGRCMRAFASGHSATLAALAAAGIGQTLSVRNRRQNKPVLECLHVRGCRASSRGWAKGSRMLAAPQLPQLARKPQRQNQSEFKH